MPKGKRIKIGYATITDDSGMNYRTIAEKLSAEGHDMNHASARNWMLRSMKKFAHALSTAKGEVKTEEELDEIARSPGFQSAISELIQKL